MTTLTVITNVGDVYGSTVAANNALEPVFEFSGAKIGYNPQDRFMVASEYNTLFVITNSGGVYGAAVDIQSHNIGPVIQYSGAKIGYNPQDRFMVAAEPVPPIQ